MPKKGPRILVATDFSEAADEAIRQADRWARETQSGLLACHIVPYFLRSAPYFTQWQRKDSAALLELEKEAAERLTERVASVTQREPGSFDIFIDSGAPDAAIIKAAVETRATLIVVGAHGETEIPRLMLGRVAERVVAYAYAPVLLARVSPNSHELLAATDLSATSLPVVSVAGQIAEWAKARLTMLHVLDVQSIPGAWLGPGSLSAKAWAKERQSAEEELRRAMQDAGVVGEAKVVEGSAARQIVAEAERLQAELVVLGTHGRTGLARLAIGSVAEKVIRQAHCSVLVLRAGQSSGRTPLR